MRLIVLLIDKINCFIWYNIENLLTGSRRLRFIEFFCHNYLDYRSVKNYAFFFIIKISDPSHRFDIKKWFFEYTLICIEQYEKTSVYKFIKNIYENTSTYFQEKQ